MFIPDIELEEHAELRAAVRGLLERRSDESKVRQVVETDEGYDAALWAQMADEVGLQGLAIAEEHGGSDGGAAELAVVFQEFGRALTPTPFFSTVALASTALQVSGDTTAQAEYLPRIASGDLIATVALSGADEQWGTAGVTGVAEQVEGQWYLSGSWSWVTDGMASQLILIPAPTASGVSLFAVDPAADGVTRARLETLDLTRRQARVTLDRAAVTLVGTEGAAAEAVDATIRSGVLALVAEQAGAAEFLMGMTLEYAKVRYQFGRPIGGFQSTKHKLAEMVFDLERMKSALRQLVNSTVRGARDLDIVSSLAKAYCSEAFFRIAAETIQVHGGIGFTWDHRAHLYFRRAKSSEFLLGLPQAHREAFLQRLEVSTPA